MKPRSLPIRLLLCRKFARRLGVVLASIVLLGISADPVRSQDVPPPLPEFSEVETAVKKQLAKRRGYKRLDIISQGDVKKVFAAIEQLDWKVAEKKKILESVLGDGDFLVRQLRTRKGVPFMRKLSGTKDAYARMDQLRRIKYGPRRIREFIRNPGGHTMILYIATTKGGKNMSRQLRRTKTGRKFGKPTTRIYTENDLLKALRQSYDAEQKRRQPLSKVKKTPR